VNFESEPEFDDPKDKRKGDEIPPEIRAEVKAVELLARREHTRAELIEKLSKREHTREAIEIALDELAARNLQSDARFAELYIEQLARKGKGPRFVQRELYKRGVDSSDSAHAMNTTDVEWQEVADRALATRFCAGADYAKMRRFMEQRGFDSAQARKNAMTMLTTSDIRREFLQFFENKNHQIVDSSSLVPGNDPTLLFTNAGMVPFKDLFLGQEKRSYDKATSAQRCVRAGGKHNDLDNVGYTARHHTFFEMLGNFSFGDYFKEEAVAYAWEFLTETLKLPKEKLWITVFEEDDEAYDIWAKKMGVPEDRISRIGAKDNFWQMGDTGPCGPCSEIFFDHGPDVWGGPPGTPEEDGDRYIEIWNLVFMQYDREADGTLNPLPKPSVDTGMGLERIAAILQGVHSNYEIDLFQALLASASDVTGNKDMGNASLKVVADHIRSCAFMIVDGVAPSNEGRGYVLRRIIRRAIRHGYNLGQNQAFFHKMVAPLVEQMGEAYPELSEAQERVTAVLAQEESRFAETLDKGMKVFEAELQGLKGDTVPGDLLFKLYDTYGFPLDLTADIARERELKVDEAGFQEAMNVQRERARAASSFAGSASKRIQMDTATEFVGYTDLTATATVTALFRDGEPLDALKAGEQGQLVVDVTPFYGESGGQIGDKGRWFAEGIALNVLDTQKSGQVFVHIVEAVTGTVTVGAELKGEVAAAAHADVQANHSATHLVHEALRRTLGEHVQQKGSLVTADNLRFDFSHDHPVTLEQRLEVEAWVNVGRRKENRCHHAIW